MFPASDHSATRAGSTVLMAMEPASFSPALFFVTTSGAGPMALFAMA